MGTDAIQVAYRQGHTFSVSRNYAATDDRPAEAGDNFVWCARVSIREGVLVIISGYLTEREIDVLIANRTRWNSYDAEVGVLALEDPTGQ